MRLMFVVFSLLAFGSSSILSAPPGRASDPELQSLERAIYKKINAYRARQGLEPMRWDDRMAAQARNHSIAMARGKRDFGHSGFKQRVRATGLSFTSAAENVGQNRGYEDPADEAVEGWLHSNGHRENIEGDYNVTGVGVARSRNGTFFFTQMFVSTKGRE